MNANTGLNPNLKRKLDKSLADYNHACRQVEEEETALTEAKVNLEAAQQAQKIVQVIAEQVQNEATKQIASCVSSCLAAVFEEPYTLDVRFTRRRGKTECDLVLMRDGHEFDDPVRQVGGGVIDVAALALRLICLRLMMPRKKMLLALDEPMRFVHGQENRRRAAELLVKLAEDAGVQVIMTTGFSWLKVGKVIDLEEMT